MYAMITNETFQFVLAISFIILLIVILMPAGLSRLMRWTVNQLYKRTVREDQNHTQLLQELAQSGSFAQFQRVWLVAKYSGHRVIGENPRKAYHLYETIPYHDLKMWTRDQRDWQEKLSNVKPRDH